MKIRISTIIVFTILIAVVASSLFLSYKDQAIDKYPSDTTQIKLYGEYHGVQTYYDVEYSLWLDYYDDGYRNLYIELPYYTAEFLNIWMHEDDDSIIDQLFYDLQGSAAGNEYYCQFFRDIKKNCPETVFHGTDIGHQFDTTGLRYLSYLEDNDMKDSPEYTKAVECIRQGVEVYTDETFYNGLSILRENYMVENFIEAYDSAGGYAMGIYGSDHTRTDKPMYMYGRLKEHYGDIISTVRISSLLFGENEPYKLGFSVTGMICIIILIFVKLLWEKKNRREDFKIHAGNKVLSVMSCFGQAAVIIALLVFKSSDPYIRLLPEGVYFDWKLIIWFAALVLVNLYLVRGVVCICSKMRKRNLYSSFAGFPVAGATLPALAALLFGIYSMNIILIAGSLIWGIGSIGNRFELKDANK